jgi:glycine/D-amino acid oxidase-like deaminating enzyme/nitrite reductase/ring-hydroxylating ferredoxin subunit
MTMSDTSRWLQDIPLKTNFPTLNKNIETNTLIIGGGMTGLITAYLLTKEGVKVTLCEKFQIGSGMTSMTTAFITQYIDKSFDYLIQTFGEEDTKLIWESQTIAIDLLEKIIKENNIDCDFQRCTAYVYSVDEKSLNFLKQEGSHAKKLNFDNIRAKCCIETFGKDLGYLEIENQAKFHPIKFLHAMQNILKNLGVDIYEETEIEEIIEGEKTVAKSKGFEIQANHIVISTHMPLNPPIELMTKLIPYQSYVIEAKMTNVTGIAEALFWDTADPYHYFRIDKRDDETYIILGGEDHKTGKDPRKNTEHFLNLENYLKDVLKIKTYEITNRWSGQIIETVDGLPYIGQTSSNPNILVNTGYAGNGMTFSTVSAMINRDIILNKTNPYLELYDPKRFKNLSNFVKQNLKTTIDMVKGKFKEADTDIANIPPGEGRIVEINGKKVAVYLDHEKNLIKLSPICSHMGCTVDWNNAEKTWDCPCHGSRFDKTGAVINGPAVEGLRRF